MSRDSLSDIAPSRDPSEALYLDKADRGMSYVEKLLPPPILTKAEI